MFPPALANLQRVPLAALLALCSGCATTPRARTDKGEAPRIHIPATGGERSKPAPGAASITIIHIRPEARDYHVHP